MTTRRAVLWGLASVTAVTAFAGSELTNTAASAIAGETRIFDVAAFQAAQAAGKPILIDISASWCPTCRRQKPIISELSAKPKFKDLVVFEVDYDRQKNIVRALGARRQSTLIAFRGSVEVGRSVADTRPASIEAMLDRTI
jgi:thioredoxin 1